MKIRYWIFTSVLVVTVFAVEYDLARRTSRSLIAKNKIKSESIAPNIANTETEENKLINKNSQKDFSKTEKKSNLSDHLTEKTFENKLLIETQKISELQADPKVADERINSLATGMNSEDIQNLSKVIADQNQNGDGRAMAVELLSRKNTSQSLQVLEDFVAHHDSSVGGGWSRNREFESVLRAQAIEGIATYPQKDVALSVLNSLASKVNESFLRERIARSGEALKGKVLPVEKQDEAALKKLVE